MCVLYKASAHCSLPYHLLSSSKDWFKQALASFDEVQPAGPHLGLQCIASCVPSKGQDLCELECGEQTPLYCPFEWVMIGKCSPFLMVQMVLRCVSWASSESAHCSTLFLVRSNTVRHPRTWPPSFPVLYSCSSVSYSQVESGTVQKLQAQDVLRKTRLSAPGWYN